MVSEESGDHASGGSSDCGSGVGQLPTGRPLGQVWGGRSDLRDSLWVVTLGQGQARFVGQLLLFFLSPGLLTVDLWLHLTRTWLDGHSVSRGSVSMVLEGAGFISTPLMRVLGESCPVVQVAKSVFRTPSAFTITDNEMTPERRE